MIDRTMTTHHTALVVVYDNGRLIKLQKHQYSVHDVVIEENECKIQHTQYLILHHLHFLVES